MLQIIQGLMLYAIELSYMMQYYMIVFFPFLTTTVLIEHLFISLALFYLIYQYANSQYIFLKKKNNSYN